MMECSFHEAFHFISTDENVFTTVLIINIQFFYNICVLLDRFLLKQVVFELISKDIRQAERTG